LGRCDVGKPVGVVLELDDVFSSGTAWRMRWVRYSAMLTASLNSVTSALYVAVSSSRAAAVPAKTGRTGWSGIT
jgi:hypothetical protein